MYFVGLAFGLGFDTASSIALISISALASEQTSPIKILMFPLLFTSGMTLVDSLDNIMMLFAYTPKPIWKKEAKIKLYNDADDEIDESTSLLQNDNDDISFEKRLDISNFTIIITIISVSVALA